MLRRIGLSFCMLLVATTAWATGGSFDAGLSPFSVRAQGVDLGYREFALFVMPGETIPLRVLDSTAAFKAQADGGRLQTTTAANWRWTAPTRPGHYTLQIIRADGARMRLQAFVMVPASAMHNGRLMGYRIGQYPARPLDNLPIYRAPTGFVEVTPAVENVHVSPHFTLGEFLCKQAGGYPKFLVLRQRLLLKLEALTAYLDKLGIEPGQIHVMSGYRTPWYNARLGNVPYSRHMWGDAADIYIEKFGSTATPPREGVDDYMNSSLLAEDAKQLFREPAYAYLQGGIGVYPATDTHPPFVHVDARGFRARWGTQ